MLRFFEGKAHYQQGRYDLAEASWTEALRLDPDRPEAGWALIDLLDKEGRVEEAHRVGMRLHEVEPDPRDRVRILLEMARLDIDQVSPGSQVQLFEPLVRQHPDNLPLAVTLGLALVRDSRGGAGSRGPRSRAPTPSRFARGLGCLADRAVRRLRIRPVRRRNSPGLPESIAGDPRFAKHEGMIAQNARDWPQGRSGVPPRRRARAVQRGPQLSIPCRPPPGRGNVRVRSRESGLRIVSGCLQADARGL